MTTSKKAVVKSDIAIDELFTSGKQKVWDDVQGIFLSLMDAITSTAHVGALIRDKKLMSHVSDTSVLSQHMAMLAGDLKEIQTSALAINARHQGKSGCADAIGNMEAIGISEEYQQLFYRYNETVLPTLSTVEQIFGEATVKLQAASADVTTPTTEL